MDAQSLSQLTNIDIQTAESFLRSLVLIRQLNVKEFLQGLFRAKEQRGLDLSRLGDDPELQRYFLIMIEDVAREADKEKIEAYKNAAIHLALDPEDFDYKANFLRTLRDLTAFDLTVLHRIYILPQENDYFQAINITKLLFENATDADSDIVGQALKRLASHNLIEEKFDRTAVFGSDDGSPILANLYFSKNRLGAQFLAFTHEYSKELKGPK